MTWASRKGIYLYMRHIVPGCNFCVVSIYYRDKPHNISNIHIVPHFVRAVAHILLMWLPIFIQWRKSTPHIYAVEPHLSHFGQPNVYKPNANTHSTHATLHQIKPKCNAKVALQSTHLRWPRSFKIAFTLYTSSNRKHFCHLSAQFTIRSLYISQEGRIRTLWSLRE